VRILLIEDEAPLAGVVKMGLENSHYTVDWFENGREGYEAAVETPYDLILLDLMLPGLDGWSICRKLRDRRSTTPILMMTALGDVDERVRGLDMGADDYLPKPFAFPELRARVAALLRRERTHRRRVLRIDDLEIDTEAREVKRAGRPVNLTPREYELLEGLATREGQVVSREMILERIWIDADTVSNTVDVHIGTLRKKIDGGRAVPLIHTIHRRGYVLRSPDGEA
jgi:DNA-binding response OmpR family regulator